ncbi:MULTISPECIES: CDF family Co(II)/Ni(II) efflux transporter DmeF [unclassified Sphingobium]|uniref:CDF family Co(II)/Ni(II) efflux transporter DmeF n=1 Tax=unclassified Sphingobium TaxID=2611147 RepID=UPI0022259254|nr:MULTISPECIES: CDF family Co(II)/Ni(II) efflux transporter DmeF [unclassified Sphingobium]MCW2381554.1 cation diffusion facilitator family transporter [Sphingobium sp. B2D3B]MCW2398339.1 cation diffusion facilitator family transporter [Sphingobium sp. B2D3C]
MRTLDIEGQTPSHDFLGASHDQNARRTHWVILLTVVTMVGEIIAGYWTGSMALLADGFHMATHAGALSIAAFAYGYARKHAQDPAYSFGTGKVGDLAGFASAMALGLVALAIASESAVRLFEPTRVAFGEATFVAVIGLLVNIASALVLMGGAHGHDHGHGHDHAHVHHHHAGHDHDAHDHDGHEHGHSHGHDNNLRSAYFHVLADALTSVLAIGALLAGRYLDWVWMDPLMGIVGALVIARWAWGLMRDTSAMLLDRSDEVLAGKVRAVVEEQGDVRVVDLHVWRVGPQAHAAIVSVIAQPEVSSDTIRGRMAGRCTLAHLTIEVR